MANNSIIKINIGRILETICIVFIILKAVGLIDWSWWTVLIPAYIFVLVIVITRILIIIMRDKYRTK